MYPLGHFALAYFFVQIVGIFNNEDYSILLIWFISILPDLDFLLAPYIVHRGPSHSIITMFFFFVPIFLHFKHVSNYFAALLSHLLGDYVTYYGIMLLWPLTSKVYVAQRPFLIPIRNVFQIEVMLFALMLLHILYSRHKTPPTNKT